MFLKNFLKPTVVKLTLFFVLSFALFLLFFTAVPLRRVCVDGVGWGSCDYYYIEPFGLLSPTLLKGLGAFLISIVYLVSCTLIAFFKKYF